MKEQSQRFPSPSPSSSLSEHSEFDPLTEITSNIIQTPLRRRAKRQHDLDPTAKHVEVLVAYDESIREFHSDADIKSYILTLFSYVSQHDFSAHEILSLRRCHISILMQVLAIISKYGW